MTISKDPKAVDSVEQAVVEMEGRLPLTGYALTVYQNTKAEDMKLRVFDLNEITSEYFMTKLRTLADSKSPQFKEIFDSLLPKLDLKFDADGGLISGFTTNYIDPMSILTQSTDGLGYRNTRQKLTPYVEKALEQLLVQINSVDTDDNFDIEEVTLAYTDSDGKAKENTITIEVRVRKFLVEMSKLCNPSLLDNRHTIINELYTLLVSNIVDLGTDLKHVDFEFLKLWFETTRNVYKSALTEQYTQMYRRHGLVPETILPLKRTVSYKSYREPKLIQLASLNADSAYLDVSDTIYKIKLLEAL